MARSPIKRMKAARTSTARLAAPTEAAERGTVSAATTPERRERGPRLASYALWKSAIDRVLALLALAGLAPLMAAIAVGIKLDSPGRAIFRQQRVGKDGQIFILYKFRTMYENNDDTKYKEFVKKYVQENASELDENGMDVYELVNDPRVTRLGRLLRKTNLDELPQFFNVLKGEMSIVGPRPDILFAVEMYEQHHRRRLAAVPGITGLWQVSGRKELSFQEQLELDCEYIARKSLLFDTKIMLKTVITILKRDGSC